METRGQLGGPSGRALRRFRCYRRPKVRDVVARQGPPTTRARVTALPGCAGGLFANRAASVPSSLMVVTDRRPSPIPGTFWAVAHTGLDPTVVSPGAVWNQSIGNLANFVQPAAITLVLVVPASPARGVPRWRPHAARRGADPLGSQFSNHLADTQTASLHFDDERHHTDS